MSEVAEPHNLQQKPRLAVFIVFLRLQPDELGIRRENLRELRSCETPELLRSSAHHQPPTPAGFSIGAEPPMEAVLCPLTASRMETESIL